LAGAAPALLTFFIQLAVPGAERWKESARTGAGRPMNEIFRAGLLKTKLVGLAFAFLAVIGTWGWVRWVPLLADQLTQGTMPHAKANAQILSGLGAVTGCLLGGIFGGRIGRRPAFFSLCLLSLVLCGFLFRAVDQYGPLFLAMVFVVGGVTAAF